MSKWTMSNSSQIKSLLLLKVTGVKIKTSLEIKIEAKEEIMANNSSKIQDSKTNQIKVNSLDISQRMLDQAHNKSKETAKEKIIKNSCEFYHYLLLHSYFKI